MLIKGKDLTVRQKAQVFAAFLYRWTTGNRQRVSSWAGIDGKPRIPLITDAEWLLQYAFNFVANGSRLSGRRYCEPVYMAD